MKALLLTFILASGAVAQHDASHHAGTVESRGNQAMGFDQQKTSHHFVTRENGGFIQVTANDANDKATVSQIRTHLQQIAKKFKAGDFSDPAFIHENTPGVETMKKLKSEIDYRYSELPGGAAVIIKTKNAEALAAIREFFKMQAEDHKTGDPTS
jgi:ribosomal protein L17